MIEEFSCKNKLEATKRERECYEELKAKMNTYRPYTTQQEYIEHIKVKKKEYYDNKKEKIKERIQEYNKTYRENNTEKLKDKGIKYYEANKEKRKERMKEYFKNIMK